MLHVADQVSMNSKLKFSYLAFYMVLNTSAFASYTTDNDLVKINSEAAQGECLPPLSGDPNNILRQNGIELYSGQNRPNVPGGSGCVSLDTVPSLERLSAPEDLRVTSLARVVSAYSTLGMGEMKDFQNTSVLFGSVRGPSRQCADHVQLNPAGDSCLGFGTSFENTPHNGVHNIGLIAHELAHKIANANEQQIFNDYRARVPSGCHLTSYARQGGRSEEIAEVMAAYLTNPSLFEGKGSECREAFRFLSELFGETEQNGFNINMTCASRRANLVTADELRRERVRIPDRARPHPEPVNDPVLPSGTVQ